MICPNCKTELVEVNGRYICSDCGREIPENEVMASDWGNGGTVRAGLYGAGTDKPETDAEPVAEYNISLTESEGEIEPQTIVPEPVTTETTEEADELTVEEVLQSQQPSEPVVSEAEASTPVPDTGFYTSPEPVAPVVPEVVTAPEVVSEIPISIPESPAEPEPVSVQPVEQEIPITVPATPAIENIPEVVPEHTEVVKDMFESTAVASAPDPGIYTDPMYENTSNSEQVQDTSNPGAKAPIPVDKRMNLIVIVAGSVLTLLLIIGGTWGYLSLSKKTGTIVPVVTEEQTVWQELQSVDGRFKISFPDQPETLAGIQSINDVETETINYTYQTDEVVYMVSYAEIAKTNSELILANTKTSLPKIVNEVAAPLKLVASKTKIGKYYNADSIDFTLSSDTASYQGKLMINGQKYILVLAGSKSGQNTEYDKFIKSFGFITEGTE